MDLMEGSLHHVIHGGGPMEDDLIAHFLYQILRGLRSKAIREIGGISFRDFILIFTQLASHIET
uniref:Uncharacterized protein n=1 Tax=Parascaris equorum TaxID=6256 RepID=A0A914RW43_PAREQ